MRGISTQQNKKPAITKIFVRVLVLFCITALGSVNKSRVRFFPLYMVLQRTLNRGASIIVWISNFPGFDSNTAANKYRDSLVYSNPVKPETRYSYTSPQQESVRCQFATLTYFSTKSSLIHVYLALSNRLILFLYLFSI